MKELVYPSTYHAMKAGPCLVGVCKHEGKCWLCEEYGIIRRYAARDTDRIRELSALVEELADKLECCSSMYHDLNMFHAHEELDAIVASARKVIRKDKQC